MNHLAPLSANLQDPRIVAFVMDFERSVRRAKVEHMWTHLGNGKTLKTKGSADSVETPETGDEVVMLEIHQHLIDERLDDPRRTGFLHFADIGASFNSARRIAGTYLVLVKAPRAPYVVAASFSVRSRKKLFQGDSSPYDKLYERIGSIHADPAHFVSEIDSADTIFDLKKMYECFLPELEFALRSVHQGRLVPLSR